MIPPRAARPRVLAVHSYYQQRGGEDVIFETECALLEAHGHEVTRHVTHNDALDARGRLRAGIDAIWNRDEARRLRAVADATRPDIAQVFNTFPLLSPAIFHALDSAGVPAVLNVQNYRLFCLNALFHRDGHLCEDCFGRRLAWPGVVHGCYRDSRAGSAIVAGMLVTHRARRTWTRRVACHIVPTAFLRDKLVAGGIDAERVAIKPNLVSPDPGIGEHRGGFALFAGRLTPEKGVATLLNAWALLSDPPLLRIAGDGPLRDLVSGSTNARVEWLGPRPKEELAALMRDATVLIAPSEWYEGAPMVIAEAYATGLPVIGTALGGVGAMVMDGVTGLLTPAGDVAALAERVVWAFERSDELVTMGRNARAVYERDHAPETGYRRLRDIYDRVLVAPGGLGGTSARAHL